MKKFVVTFLLSFSTVTALYAQVAKTKIPPPVPIEVREKFFKAQSEYQSAADTLREATSTAQAKNAILQDQIKKIQAACGDEFQPTLDKDGDLVCVDKPKATESPKK